VPFSTEWVSEGRGVYLAGTGLLTGQEILDAKTSLLRESDRLKGLHYRLIDLTDVAELRVTRDDVLEFVQVDMQIALIVPGPSPSRSWRPATSPSASPACGRPSPRSRGGKHTSSARARKPTRGSARGRRAGSPPSLLPNRPPGRGQPAG
jgi:hypothetical protein